jgi:hypothetical protein
MCCSDIIIHPPVFGLKRRTGQIEDSTISKVEQVTGRATNITERSIDRLDRRAPIARKKRPINKTGATKLTTMSARWVP